MAYDYTTEVFNYFSSKGRKRPTRVRGNVPVQPSNAPKREDVLPIALYEKNEAGYPDVAPHNTVRGHLIGLDSLGGKEERENLVPMYGQFNLSTYKTKFENVLKQNVQVHGVASADLDLTIRYDDEHDARVPVEFKFTLTINNSDGSTRKVSDTIPHPAPQAAYENPPEGLGEYITKMQKRMTGANWWVEDHVVNRENAKKHMEHGQLLNVPPKDYAQRPYAVIDYILYQLEDSKYFGGSCRPELYNGGEFSADQIRAIFATNLAKNDGYYKSDAPNDYVYKGNINKFKYRDQTKSYYLHAHSSGGKQDGVLLKEGYHQMPEIDHIVMKRHQYKPGCNAYSNARVISRYLNSEDRGNYSK